MDLSRTAWVVLAVLLMAARMFAARMAWEFMPRASAQDALNCEEDFTYREDAQAVLDRDPSDPNGLDRDNDGMGCDLLPRRAGGGEPPVGGTTAAVAAGDLDCADFATREEAQAALESDPSDPNGLDADDDGIACEELFGEEITEVTTEMTELEAVTSGKDQVRESVTMINIPNKDLPPTGGPSAGADRTVVWLALAGGTLMLGFGMRRGFR